MIYIYTYIHTYIYKKIYMGKGKAGAQGSKSSMGLTSEMAKAGREARGFSGTVVLFVPGPVYL